MQEETKNWLKKADKDLGTAIFAMQSVDGPLPVTTGLHCQRSVENYLKAYLQEHNAAFSNHQTLASLFEACIAMDESFDSLRADMDQLEGYSIASRYPKASDAHEHNKEAVAVVQRVKEFIAGKLG